ALPGNSAAMDLTGSTTSWFRSRSNVTSYGTHNVFSGGEYTTSGATPFQAGILAMVQSAGLNLRDSGRLPGFDRLTPNEIKQVLMDTAQPIIPNALPPQPLGPGAPPGTKQPQWPGNPNSATDATHTNWSTQYGYGRPDVGAATAMVMAGKIPPTADITAPQWYAYIDPTVTRTLEVDGSFARARPAAARPRAGRASACAPTPICCRATRRASTGPAATPRRPMPTSRASTSSTSSSPTATAT